jgi:hypothetical protein
MNRSQDSSVSAVTRLQAGQPGFGSWEVRIILFVPLSIPPVKPIQTPIQWVLRSFPWPGREADDSPPPRSKVKKAWSYISTPSYICMVWSSVTLSYLTLTYQCYECMSLLDIHLSILMSWQIS